MSYTLISTIVLAMMAFKPVSDGRLITKSGHISFYSHTPVEDITADNYKVISTIDPATGAVAFSVPMQSFEFEKALMQEHFNGKGFLNTKAFPQAKFNGTIVNIADIDFLKPGTYQAKVKGTLTIKGKTRDILENGTVSVKEGGIVNVQTRFMITLADYNITFSKGKPSTNIAKEIEVSLNANYTAE